MLPFDLSIEEGKLLVEYARKAVKEFLTTAECIGASEDIPISLREYCGVFVTINSLFEDKRRLRGCIGNPYPTKPLVEAVIGAAVSAATQDPRFKPLSRSELDRVVFEISVLTPPEMIEVGEAGEYVARIRVGEDGLIVEKGIFKGLLLPQVPVEWGWSVEEFLRQCCIKAGLSSDCWRGRDVKIYKFNAIIFEEKKPNGEIVRRCLA